MFWLVSNVIKGLKFLIVVGLIKLICLLLNSWISFSFG